QRSFLGVAISATSNALMVAERWSTTNTDNQSWCSEQYNETRVSVIDISDPSGNINVHTRFSRHGDLSDQFKQTYIYDEANQRGVYLGIFARNEWSDCDRVMRNTITSVDITDGANPKELSSLDFGKPDETVRGSLFDARRKVAYAITVLVAQSLDPLYAINIANLDKLEVLSAIDGLSGDVNVFRPIGDKGEFLLTVGRDNSAACEGFDNDRWAATRVAVSIFDTRDLQATKLVQRRCVALERARWSSSAVNSNLDQAHKMIGMYSDALVNLVAVPVSYYEETRNDESSWWWYSLRSAVGMLSWDLSRYDPALPPEQQSVLQNLATVIHPDGEVKRTVFLQRPGVGDTKRRVMLTLSDTHMAFNDVTDLERPLLQSSVEVAPYSAGVYRLGDHLVEQISVGGDSWGSGGYSYDDRRPTLFKVKRPASDGTLGDATELSRFMLAGVQKVLAHGDSALRQEPSHGWTRPPLGGLLVVELLQPKRRGHRQRRL
ncbi:MAG: beta-propeller domain-containing protein, partial [Deltaproteobacteria bacterium]|nr:beta-propeller domain-containing protein [Deltaproteobacteria bacterium]